MASLPRHLSSRQSLPRLRVYVRTPYRGPAGAIDPQDPAPFDAVCTRPEAYDKALVRTTEHLAACVQELAQLTPPESDLQQLRHVLAFAQNYLQARRPHAAQLVWHFHPQPPSGGRRRERETQEQPTHGKPVPV